MFYNMGEVISAWLPYQHNMRQSCSHECHWQCPLFDLSGSGRALQPHTVLSIYPPFASFVPFLTSAEWGGKAAGGARSTILQLRPTRNSLRTGGRQKLGENSNESLDSTQNHKGSLEKKGNILKKNSQITCL